MQGLFKNDFPGLMFQNFLGLDGKPVGPGIPGRYVLEQIYGMTTRRGKWVDLGIICAMIAIYRILFFVVTTGSSPALRYQTHPYLRNILEDKISQGNFSQSTSHRSCHVRRARVEIEISFRNFKRCKILLRHPRVILIYSCLQEKYYSSTNTFDVPKQCGY
jgi:hypothetical protein